MKTHLRDALILLVGATLGGMLLGGGMPSADAQSGANTRQFDLSDGVFPPAGGDQQTLVLGDISTLDLDRDYRFTLTGVVAWADGASGQRIVDLAIDLEGYDANGGVLDWDSQLFPRVGQQYQQTSGSQRAAPVVAQAVTFVPNEVVTLRISLFDQSGATAPSAIEYHGVRLTMTPTGPPF